MISVRCEWTLKWSLPPPPPSFLRALIKWGSLPLISPAASSPPILACGPLYLLATATQIYLFPGGEKGEKTGRGDTRVAPRGSCLPSQHLQPGGAPGGGHRAERPHHPHLCSLTRPSRPPRKVWRFKTCLHPQPTSPLSLLPIFKSTF